MALDSLSPPEQRGYCVDDDGFQLIIISRSLARSTIESDIVTTSSQKFEKSFLLNISDISYVHLIYISSELRDPLELSRVNVTYSESTKSSLIRRILSYRKINKCSIIATGYDPVLMFCMIFLRFFGIKCFTFIYDTHLTVVSGRRWIKRIAIKTYFGLGFFLARFLNGWIVLNDIFIKNRKINITYLKIKIGADRYDFDEHVAYDDCCSCDEKVFIISGTLNNDNGIKIALDAFRHVKGAKLHVYGYGPLEKDVIKESRINRSIVFFGRVTNARLLRAQAQADFLLHLRDPSSLSSQYSYPSKLIEYLNSGTVVLSNTFPGIDEVQEFVVSIPEYNALSLAETLSKVISGGLNLPDPEDVKLKLRANRRWVDISREVLSFMSRSWKL